MKLIVIFLSFLYSVSNLFSPECLEFKYTFKDSADETDFVFVGVLKSSVDTSILLDNGYTSHYSNFEIIESIRSENFASNNIRVYQGTLAGELNTIKNHVLNDTLVVCCNIETIDGYRYTGKEKDFMNSYEIGFLSKCLYQDLKIENGAAEGFITKHPRKRYLRIKKIFGSWIANNLVDSDPKKYWQSISLPELKHKLEDLKQE